MSSHKPVVKIDCLTCKKKVKMIVDIAFAKRMDGIVECPRCFQRRFPRIPKTVAGFEEYIQKGYRA
jgi:DNA-directed RNA polymerase subunit RPC12/RpoP